MRNYVLEGQLKEAAAAAGCLESAIEDFALDVQAFRVTTAAEIPQWVEKAKTAFPHRFLVQSDHDLALCQSAFLLKNLTDQMRLHKAVGPQRFAELKALYANGLPESEKKKMNGSADHKTNPWAAEGNINLRTGRYTDTAIQKQMSFCRAAGPEKAAQVAAVVGSKLGDPYPQGRGRK